MAEQFDIAQQDTDMVYQSAVVHAAWHGVKKFRVVDWGALILLSPSWSACFSAGLARLGCIREIGKSCKL